MSIRAAAVITNADQLVADTWRRNDNKMGKKMNTDTASQRSPANEGATRRRAIGIRRLAAVGFTAFAIIAPVVVFAAEVHAGLVGDRHVPDAGVVLASASSSTAHNAPDTQGAPCPGAYYCAGPGTDPSVPYGPDPMVPYGPDPLSSSPGPQDLAS